MPVNVEQTPPPRIGKIGPYTVFITPPATPTATTTNGSEPLSNSPKSVSSNSPKKATPGFSSPRTPVQVPVQSPPPPPPPPVQAPPSQFYPTKPPAKPHSSFGFFWDAVAKVQNGTCLSLSHCFPWIFLFPFILSCKSEIRLFIYFFKKNPFWVLFFLSLIGILCTW